MKYLEKSLAKVIQWKRANPEVRKANERARVRREKEMFIAAYGGACMCCGDTTFEFLTAEHPNGRDDSNRKDWGWKVYYRARMEGYPKGVYELLCMNCNFAKGKYGVCPHQKPVLQLVAGLSN
jgi:hypothetical protein